MDGATKEERIKQWGVLAKKFGEEANTSPDFGLVCSYGYMINSKIIQHFKDVGYFC